MCQAPGGGIVPAVFIFVVLGLGKLELLKQIFAQCLKLLLEAGADPV